MTIQKNQQLDRHLSSSLIENIPKLDETLRKY